ncbi:MAG: M56 family metallopeptidase [Anaeromyxobacteraceae bacterium]
MSGERSVLWLALPISLPLPIPISLPFPILAPNPAPAPAPVPTPAPPTPDVRSVLGALWLLGAAAAAWRLARGARGVRGLVARATPLPPGHPAHAALAALGRSTRLRLPRLARSGEIRAPLCAGLLDPVILLPDWPLPPRALRLVLAHELGHLRRLDLWLAWVPALAELALWFHPLVRLAAREHAQAREEACDALALELTGDAPADYGPLLVAFGTGHPRLALAAAAGAPHVRQLERRLRMLSSHGTKAARRARWLGAVVLAAIAPALVPFALAQAPAPQPPAPPAPAPAARAPLPPAPAAPAAAVPAAPATPAAPPARPGRVARAAPLPPAPPAPPAPRAGKVPPPPPAPAAPIPPDDGEFLVLRDGKSSIVANGANVNVSSSNGVLHLSVGDRDVVRTLTAPYVAFGRDGKAWVVTDPAEVARLRKLYEGIHDEEMDRASAEMTKLGAEQSRLGDEQSRLGERQGELGRRMGAGHEDLDALGKQMDQLGAQMDVLGGQMDAIGEKMDAVGKRMDAAGKRIEARAHAADEASRKLRDEWIQRGVAKPLE